MDLAEILRLSGDTQAADAAAEEAIHFYELKGNVLAASRVRSQLPG